VHAASPNGTAIYDAASHLSSQFQFQTKDDILETSIENFSVAGCHSKLDHTQSMVCLKIIILWLV